MPHDVLGNEVSTTSAATLSAIDDFVEGFLGYERRAAKVLAAADADPESVLANVYAGFSWMFLETRAPAARPRSVWRARRRQAPAMPVNGC